MWYEWRCHILVAVDSLLKGVPHFVALGATYFISGALYFAGLMTASMTRNQRCHEFYAVFFLIQTTIVSFLIFGLIPDRLCRPGAGSAAQRMALVGRALRARRLPARDNPPFVVSFR